MKFVYVMLMALALGACAARGKMGRIEKGLPPGIINDSTPIYVEKISTAGAVFTGDKANNPQTRRNEKATIEALYHLRIVEALRHRGFNAQVANGRVKKGMVLRGRVTRIGHGSGAARFFVGFGAGQANLIADFVLEERIKRKTLSKFEVVATSGAESNVFSYMDKHLYDGADKVALYFTGDPR